MDVLVELARHPGEVLSKQHLIDTVWPQEFVADSVLHRAIAELRRSLGDDARRPAYIETISRRGYRLIAEVAELDVDDPPSRPRPGRWWWIAAGLVVVSITAAVVVWRPGDRTRRAPEAGILVRMRQLTADPGVEAFPSFAPSGRAVAYTSDRGGGFEIWVRQLAAEGEDLEVTGDGGFNVQPAWSPDGDVIAYHSVERGGIWIVPALGGNARQVSVFGSEPEWSPDGGSILFRSETFRAFSPHDAPPLPGVALWSVPSRGGEPRPVTRPGDPPGGHGMAVFTPDGGTVVFASRYSGTMSRFSGSAAVWTVPAGGGRPRRAAQIGVEDLVMTPGGRTVLGLSLRDGEPWLVSIPVTPRGADDQPRYLTRLDGRNLALSSDGRHLAFSRFTSSSHLWSVAVDPTSGEATGPPQQLTSGTGVRDTVPVVSPDGARLAFQRSVYGDSYKLMLLDLVSGRLERLDEGSAAGTHSWSPDGTLLRFKRGSSWWQMGVESRRKQLVAVFPDDRVALWLRQSPDGRRAAYVRTDAGRISVWVSHLDGSDAHQLTFEDDVAGFPRWSPDGTRIAYEVGRWPEVRLAIRSADGGEPIVFDVGTDYTFLGDWSPKGDGIVYAARRRGRWNLFTLSLATGRCRQITDFPGERHYVRWPTWSPEGDQVIYEYRETSSDLWIAELGPDASRAAP